MSLDGVDEDAAHSLQLGFFWVPQVLLRESRMTRAFSSGGAPTHLHLSLSTSCLRLRWPCLGRPISIHRAPQP